MELIDEKEMPNIALKHIGYSYMNFAGQNYTPEQPNA
jgi:hypothetical protein